jgi:hypothetical protein
MKQHIYCRSGQSSTHRLNRIASRTTKRNVYSVQEKIRILRVVRTMVTENNITFAEAASAVTVDQSLISRWRKQEGAWGFVKRPDMLHVASGPRSVLLNIERELLDFVETWRSKGLPVNRITLMRKARALLPELEGKSEHALKMSISRFMKKNRLVHRMATHKAQRHPSEVEGEALDYLTHIRPILLDVNRDPNYIYNMDQTPVPTPNSGCRTPCRRMIRTTTLPVMTLPVTTMRGWCKREGGHVHLYVYIYDIKLIRHARR